MKAAGYKDADITLFSVPEHPKDGGIVAVLPGTDKRLKPMLLLGHLDVVEAKREDWTRDPFKLIEEDGFLYGRGTVDDKAMSAVWADTLIRLKKTPPKRTIKMALTCGEETTFAFNGAEWLARNKPDLIAAEFVLNEGGGGRLDSDGKRELLAVQVGEKAAQNYTFLATNPGGHSSQPTPENAIYELADAVKAVQGYEFPIHLTDTTRAFLTATAQKSAAGWAMRSRGCSPTRRTRRPTRSSARTRRCIRRCAPPASRLCSRRAMPKTRCPSARPPISTAASSPARRSRGRWRNSRNWRAEDHRHRQPAGPPDRDPAQARPEDHRPDEDAGGQALPGVPLVPMMSTARPTASSSRRSASRLRRAGHLHREGHVGHPRPERAHPGQLAL